MIKPDLESIIGALKIKGLDLTLEAKTQQARTVLMDGMVEYPLFIRLFPESDMVQMLAFFPVQLKSKAVADVARLLHLFNKELDVPGFGLDETSKTVFFRCMIPATSAGIEEELLHNYLDTIHFVTRTFLKPIDAVATGSTTFDALMEQASDKMKQMKAKG